MEGEHQGARRALRRSGDRNADQHGRRGGGGDVRERQQTGLLTEAEREQKMDRV